MELDAALCFDTVTAMSVVTSSYCTGNGPALVTIVVLDTLITLSACLWRVQGI